MSRRWDWLGDWPDGDLVVVTGANGWDKDRMADHQLAAALAELVPVLFVDMPSSALGRLRTGGWRGVLGGPRLVRVAPRVARLTPEGLPGVSRPWISRINRHLVAAQVRRAARRLGGHVRAHVEANQLTPTMGLLGADTDVYWAQDDFVAMAPLVGVAPEIYEKSDRDLTRRAHVVIAANPLVADDIRGRGRTVSLIPFGCDVELFRRSLEVPPAADVSLDGPVALLMGTINDRLDLDLLHATAEAGGSLLLVGPPSPTPSAPFPQASFDALVARPNVQWMGRRDFRELPAYLARAAVGLVPYNHQRFNEGSFPLKTLEYLAAGLPVVATDLPAITWLGCPDIHVADDPGAFAAAVVSRLAQPSTEVDVARRVRFAKEHSWSDRARAFARVVGIDTPTG